MEGRLDKTRCSHLLFSSKRKKNVQFGHGSWTREGEEACGGKTATLHLPRIPELAGGSHLCLPPGSPAYSSGVERRRRGEPAGTASSAAHARRGEPGVCGRAGNASSERLEPAGEEHLVDGEAGPSGALTRITGASRGWRPAAGWASPRCARAASCLGYARPGGSAAAVCAAPKGAPG